MRTEAVEQFFATARERQLIYMRREAGEQVWTKDPVFLVNRFCNVFREQDRTTQWFKEHIREPLRDEPREVLLGTIAFRWFNRIETWDRILSNLSDKGDMDVNEVFSSWPKLDIKGILRNISPVVTGAYVIKTPDGMSKLDGVLWCINQAVPRISQMADYFQTTKSLEWATRELTKLPYMGPFMAYQVVCDLKSTCLLEDATDRMTWAQVGPGSARGLGRLLNGNPHHFNRAAQAQQTEMIEMMRLLLAATTPGHLWPSHFPTWELSDIQHWLCEYDKYCRVLEGGKMKQVYRRAT